MTAQIIQDTTTHLIFYDKKDPLQHVGNTVSAISAKNSNDMLDALENLWKFCIPDEQTAVGRIHLDHAKYVIDKVRGKV